MFEHFRQSLVDCDVAYSNQYQRFFIWLIRTGKDFIYRNNGLTDEDLIVNRFVNGKSNNIILPRKILVKIESFFCLPASSYYNFISFDFFQLISSSKKHYIIDPLYDNSLILSDQVSKDLYHCSVKHV